MPPKGYCASADVEAYLGLTFTAAQTEQAVVLLPMAEDAVDAAMGHEYALGTQSNEAHYYPSCDLYLRHAPITSVTSVAGRRGMTDTETTLTAGTDYEVRSLPAGHLYLVSPGRFDRVRVTYVPVATVPDLVKQATILTIAAWLQPTLTPGLTGVQSYKLPDLEVVYAKGTAIGGGNYSLPPNAREVLAQGGLIWPVVG